MYLPDVPPRPRWNHPCVKEEAARQCVKEVRSWAEDCGVVEDDSDDREFLALLSVAFIESPDAYQAGRYLEDFFGWPVQIDLMRVLDSAYGKMKYITQGFVHAWVMENNVRFPAKKGQTVRVRVGDAEITGEVLEVIRREARAILAPIGKKKPITVYAEEVQEVMPRKPRQRDKPQPPEIA